MEVPWPEDWVHFWTEGKKLIVRATSNLQYLTCKSSNPTTPALHALITDSPTTLTPQVREMASTLIKTEDGYVVQSRPKTLTKREFPKFDQKAQKLQNRDLRNEQIKVEKEIWKALPKCRFVGEEIDMKPGVDGLETAERLSREVSPPHRMVLFVSGTTAHKSKAKTQRKARAAVAYSAGEKSSNGDCEWVRRLFMVNTCGPVSDLHMNAELLGIAEALAIALVWATQQDQREEQPEVVVYTTCLRTLRYIDRLRDEATARREAYPARKVVSRSQWLHQLGVRVKLRAIPNHLYVGGVEGLRHAQGAAKFALGRNVIPLLRDGGLDFMIKKQDQLKASLDHVQSDTNVGEPGTEPTER